MGELDGRVILVTGGASGIGRATALVAAAAGASVAVVDRDGEAAAAVVEELAGVGGGGLAVLADVTDDDVVGAAVAATVDRFSKLDGVVTCAGVFVRDDALPIAEVDPATFEAVVRVNLFGTFLTLRHALPHLVEAKGSAVTIASTAAVRGHGLGVGYTASKGGVEAITRLAAVEYGPFGVRVNCVAPGGVDTPMAAATHSGEAGTRFAAKVPLRKLALPHEIAAGICFLLSGAASHVTGTTLVIDGGSTIAG